MPRIAHVCALSAGLIAALAVAHERIGLALALVLLLLLAAGVVVAPRARWRAGLIALGAALAVQPVLRDAGWVIWLDSLAVLATAGALVTAPGTWGGVARSVTAPLRLVRGTALAGRATVALMPERAGRRWRPVLTGVALAVILLSGFGALFVAADAAFADLADETLDLQLDTGELMWRAVLGMTAAAVVGSLVAAARPRPLGPKPLGRVPGVVELRIALSAVVALFIAFVVVQLQVLFGGAGYVRRTTGLGLGEYARQGFTAMLVVAALTLAVVAFAARRRDPVVRGLLAALCLLCLVVLVSAQHRLGLVVDAYGLTRVRVAGEAAVPWLAGLLALVLAAGAHPGIARRGPRLAITGTLAAILAFSLSDPDRRIAGRAVDRHARTGQIDLDYLEGLSADAIPALRRLPEPLRNEVLEPLVRDLERPDGIAGLNLSRARAR
jgi:hypothetical protein